MPTDLGIDVDGLEIASVVNVQDLWERLDLKAGEGDLTPRTGTQATARLSTARGLLPIGWHAVATGLGVTAVISLVSSTTTGLADRAPRDNALIAPGSALSTPSHRRCARRPYLQQGLLGAGGDWGRSTDAWPS